MFLLFLLSLLLLTESIICAPKQHSKVKPRRLLQICQHGRVCMDSCYVNDQPAACDQTNVIKSVRFEPPFTSRPPSIILRLTRFESYDDFLENDVTIKKENLTSSGMNIRFNPSIKSFRDIFCIEWQACSFDSG